MTTAADVIVQLDQFIDDVNELLASNTVESVVELLELIGGGDLVHTLVSELSDLLKGIHRRMGDLIATIEDPLRHAQALSGLLGLLQPLLVGLGRLVQTSADQLEDAGLSEVITISQPIIEAVRFGDDVLEIGAGVLDMLPPPETLRELETSFGELITTVDSYVEATAS